MIVEGELPHLDRIRERNLRARLLSETDQLPLRLDNCHLTLSVITIFRTTEAVL